MADNNAQARFNMVEQQIRPWEIFDPRILSLLEELPREQFVPPEYLGLAYADIEIPIGHSQRMMYPRMEANLLLALDLHSDDRVLEVGTGSGYLTACLAKLAGRVVSIEIHPDLSEAAAERLNSKGLRNVELLTGDALTTQLAEQGPFDAIAVTGSLPSMAQVAIFRKLLKLQGRLFVIVGEPPVMEATLITRVSEHNYREESILETEQAPLENAEIPATFEF